MKPNLVPSLLSADFSNLNGELQALQRAEISHLHLDVMDGQFVPNISFGPGLIAGLRPHTALFFDCHLMVKEPGHLYSAFADAGCQLLTIHQEAVTHLHREISQIRTLGLRAGVALNPATSLSTLDYVLEDLDLVLVMSVNPGYGGQSFIPSALDKIAALRKKLDARNPKCIIEVDGGIKEENVQAVLDAGANWIVAGSAVFAPGETEKRARSFREKLDAYVEKAKRCE
uniref:ribulose-phosphate 3-epimerase n=1 Tax=Ndongobacter massiliensis TaxID=1871025 RepID=UPI000931E5D5|nr:ribulose-phosphate 3-epimerase [Ndongobacter massiliensis]